MEIASARKVVNHTEKLAAYLEGRPLFPAARELDLSTECKRRCPLCPSTIGIGVHRLRIEFVERLLAVLGGETRGLLLSGGEPTMAETFTATLQIARKHGFLEIAVVTNGDFLDDDSVAEALCRYVTAVRISLYDWSHISSTELGESFRRIESLRERIERSGSPLEIGISALTRAENASRIPEVGRSAAAAGAHWIYFHPLCIRWEEGAPQRIDQRGVADAIRGFRAAAGDGFRVLSFADRYAEDEIRFDGYHAAHFLLVVGADAVNYLGAEVKYQPSQVLADLGQRWDKRFLWNEKRLKRIATVRSGSYPALGSRHRGVLYNHVIQRMLDCGTRPDQLPQSEPPDFLYPHIL